MQDHFPSRGTQAQVINSPASRSPASPFPGENPVLQPSVGQTPHQAHSKEGKGDCPRQAPTHPGPTGQEVLGLSPHHRSRTGAGCLSPGWGVQSAMTLLCLYCSCDASYRGRDRPPWAAGDSEAQRNELICPRSRGSKGSPWVKALLTSEPSDTRHLSKTLNPDYKGHHRAGIWRRWNAAI